MRGVQLLAQTEGIFAEVTGGVVISTLKKLVASGAIKKNETTVAFITGAGPRTQEIFSDMVKPYVVKAKIESVEEVLGVRV